MHKHAQSSTHAGASPANEQEIEIHMPDGQCDGFLYASDRSLPGLLFLTDIGGIRPSQRDMAAKLAAEGYTVLLPNIFYRTGQAPLFELPVKYGAEKTTQRINQLLGSLPPQLFERDVPAYVDFLASHGAADDKPMGVVGLCFSGALALRTAALRPDRTAAAASFHGGRLAIDDPNSPHLLLPGIKAQLYFGHAMQDRSMPEEAITKLDKALEAWGGQYESEVYGAHHGWTVPDNPAYNQPQAERAFEKLKALLEKTLTAGASKSAAGPTS